uniref:DUF1087 domain-containing protein n=1 Tax=Angiostrongylus cantonensis TaxID=6313 RepID=A0A0K0D4R0_ANGCA
LDSIIHNLTNRSIRTALYNKIFAAGTSAVQDELAQITSLKSKKGDFESSVKEAAHVERLTKVEDEVLQAGKHFFLMRFLTGGPEEDGEEEESERDPNIIREDRKKKKEELHFAQVDDIKNKWKTGEVETAEYKEAAERKELEQLKGGPSVKERFHERNESDTVVERHWDRSELDTAGEFITHVSTAVVWLFLDLCQSVTLVAYQYGRCSSFQ